MAMEDIIESIVVGTGAGYGGGVVVQTIFGVATGAITAGSSISAVLGGPLVLVLSAVGLGLGFAAGFRAHRAGSAVKAA